jgi:hypothetical protein
MAELQERVEGFQGPIDEVAVLTEHVKVMQEKIDLMQQTIDQFVENSRHMQRQIDMFSASDSQQQWKGHWHQGWYGD